MFRVTRDICFKREERQVSISPKGVQMRKSGQPFSIGWPLVLVVALIAQSIGMSGQSSPSTLPLVGFSDLQYVGAFRVPAEASNGKYYSYGGKGMAFNPATNGLFLAAGGNVAEISIPSPVNSSDVNALPVATYLQPFADPAEGHMGDLPGGGTLDNLMVYGNRLYVTGIVYYDANNMQRQSHFARSVQLSQSSFSGWSSVWQADRSGFVAGMMAPVPAEWQSSLGGPALTGQCCVPIVTRTSFGPAAVAFNPAQVGLPAVPATPLLYYPSSNPTLGQWNGSNPTYGGTTQMGGMAIIPGTRTVLYFGSNGSGPHCYGDGIADQAAADRSSTDELCYDPVTPDKGSHAYPYRYQVWAYDMNDFVAVKAGAKQPWEVRPYGVWAINFPTPESKVRIGGVAYDSQRQLIYVSQLRADQRGFGYMPLIHAFRVTSATGSLPPTSNTVGSLSMRADKAAPQAARTPITFTATPTGGAAPYEYSWWVNDGTAWTLAKDWTTSPQFVWTPTTVNPSFQVGARVRSSGNTGNVPEATAMMPFAIGTATSARATAVVLTANRNAPQAPFTAITWTAAPVGGTAPQYKWLVSDGSTSTVVSNWSATATYVWTPSTVNPNYKVSVWVRSTGNAADSAEASAEQAFRIDAAVPPSESTAPEGAPSARVSGVSLTSNKQAPQAPGTPIVWSATPAGGIAPHQYKWWVYDGANWNVISNWSGAASYTWTPSAANARYRVAVWVRSAGNTNDYHESSTEQGFAIESPGAPSAPALAVRLTADKRSPQAAGSTITWTAALTGGVGAYEYKWHLYDGNWKVVKTWSTSNSYTWTPTTANSRYRVAVWVRSVGNTNDYWQVAAEDGFVISGGK